MKISIALPIVIAVNKSAQ